MSERRPRIVDRMAGGSSRDTGPLDEAADGVDLYWLPLGAGRNTRCVRTNGRIYEALTAGRQRRERRDLYHAALVVHLDGERYAIEMGPAWGNAEHERGVVCEGPVGVRWLGRCRFFSYEVRFWQGGVIPD